MDVDVVMPQLGESIPEGTVTVWLVAEGDSVERDQAIAEVETDKAAVEIPAPVAGTVKALLVQPEDTVEVGARIAVIDAAKADAEIRMEVSPATPREAGAGVFEAPEEVEPEEPPKREEPTRPKKARRRPAAPVPKAARLKGASVPMTPLVRRLVRRHGLDPTEIEATGPDGRLTREDVEKYLAERPKEEKAPEPAEPAAKPAKARKAEPAEGDRTEKLSPRRRKIAERLLASVRGIPHVTTVAEVDMTAVHDLREERKADFEEAGLKLTYTPFILAAVAEALGEFPALNSSLVGDTITYHGAVHLGVAVSDKRGLVVPVVRDAGSLGFRALAEKVADLAGRARSGKLKPDETGGSTFTVTNPGVFGAVLSTPIINPPEAAILGVERIAETPAVRESEIVARWMMNLCLSYDHRIVDGETAIKFLQKVRALLESADFDLS
jgi:2-oxoglutarate dehydrogenase E2 component (dihydrolipoamide succinyltransferase)